MRLERTALPLCLAALLAAAARAAPPDGRPPGLEVRSGRVAAVDWGDRRLTLLGPAGRFEVAFDRNTVVYLPGGLGTMRDVAPGAEVRTVANPDGVAAWIEVRSPLADGGAAAAPDGGGAAGSDGGPPAWPEARPPAGLDGGPPGSGADAPPDGGPSAAGGGDPGRPDGGSPR